MLPIDSCIREEVLTHKGNLVISACAGTGKTFITVQRIQIDVDENKTFRTFAAITFTRKAAKEIASRLGVNRGEGFIGTNDNFVWSEVIQPFMYDVFGLDFKKNINPDYTDENQILSFNDGIEKIREIGLMCKYNDNHMNFAFQLALYILKHSHSARRFLKAKYFRIYIDEYQDSDVDMHKFFMFLCDDLKIPLFMVGDTNQSIYGWRGAYSDGFKSLFNKPGFKLFTLWHNFRSNKAIQNYSTIFMNTIRDHYEKIDFNDEVILYKFSDEDNACEYILNWIDKDKKCAFLNYSNDNARWWSEKLNEHGLEFEYIPYPPIDDSKLESEHVWIARGIASYILTKRYSEYDFRDEIPVPESFKVYMLKSKLKKIKEDIGRWDEFRKSCKMLYTYLGYEESTDKTALEIEKLIETISDDQYVSSYNSDRYLQTSGTIHSSKGLEYNQVIINAGNYNFTQPGIDYLHYVAVSRPEDRLLIIAQQGFFYNRYICHVDASIEAMNELDFIIKREDIVTIEE